MNRRSFLRGLAWAAAALAVAALPVPAGAQAREPRKDDPKDPDKPKEDDKKATDPARPTEPEFLEEHTGADGRKFRVCPVCGYNMYKQDRTWTCENCGFTYTE